MCLIQLAFCEETKSWTVAANRDEFIARDARPAHVWENGIFAGRDVQAGGTWLGMKGRRFAAVTNVRHPKSRIMGERSRGSLVTDFLTSSLSAAAFIAHLQQHHLLYGGFNILLFDGEAFYHYNNIFHDSTKLTTGYYTLSNHTLNTPWPKSVRVREHFIPLYEANAAPMQFIHMMQDSTRAPVHALPETGLAPQMEENLSSIFIHIEGYGTRCTTYIQHTDDKTIFVEQTYENGVPTTLVEQVWTCATN